MSAHLLAGFIRDVTAINPAFRTSTSSLRPLIRRLRSSTRTPTPLTVDQAAGLCGGMGEPRLGKYMPAIKRLVTVWGKGGHAVYPIEQNTSRLQAESIQRLCFRGDGRPPDEIFSKGFEKQHVGTDVTYQNYMVPQSGQGNLRLAQGMSRGGDISRFTAVCVSPDMDLAALFPSPTADTVDETAWLYMVMLRSGYNTHGRQVLDALKGFRQLATHELGGQVAAQAHADRVDAIAMLLYGREMAADAIAAIDVLMALETKRRWNHEVVAPNPIPGQPPRRKPDFWQGGQYRVKNYVLNNPAIDNLSAGWAAAFAGFQDKIDAGMINKTWYVMPTPADGYAASTRT